VRQLKGIIEKLGHKRDYLDMLVLKRHLALQAEQYGLAHEIKAEFDSIWYTCPDEFRHLRKFLKEDEQTRFITY
jgi:hypothetical protein